MSAEILLRVEDLVTSFQSPHGAVKAVDGCSFQLRKAQTVGVVGESGCGKSMTSLSIMRLVPYPQGKIVGGRLVFEGRDLLTLKECEMRQLRGNRISMIFQEPMTSLNPVYTVGDQISEVFMLHKGLRKKDALQCVIEMLNQVRISSPQQRIKEYPHQLSGGMRQRVMIAMALACQPSLLIADEPTTALDVTIQSQILALINQLQAENGMSLLLVTHDLGVVAETCDQVIVMYAGKIVEQAEVHELFYQPAHPYTHGLLTSIPKLGERKKRLYSIPGMVPSLGNLPQGCRFQDRCDRVKEICREVEPQLEELKGGRKVACFYPYL